MPQTLSSGEGGRTLLDLSVHPRSFHRYNYVAKEPLQCDRCRAFLMQEDSVRFHIVSVGRTAEV
jgi:hypothetical protein